MTDIHDLTALGLAAQVRTRNLSPVEAVDHYAERIDRLNSSVGAYLTSTPERAAEEALLAEKRIVREGASDLPPLFGVPVPVKDLTAVSGVRMTYGSAAFHDHVATWSDGVALRLAQAGAPLLGKTATCEFGLTCYTESDIAPPARTPWDLSRSAGGSSGGAAAAVAAGLAPLAHGSDGGGSIRIPASACGLFGIKPTRGRVSAGPHGADLLGLAAHGPLARTVADAAALLDVLAGARPGDLYRAPSLPPGDSFLAAASRRPARLRIGRTLESAVPDAVLDPECVLAYERTTELLAELGHTVEELPAGTFPGSLMPLFGTLWSVTAAAGQVPPERVGLLRPMTRWLRERGERVSGPELLRTQAALQTAFRAITATLDGYDAILHPTLASPPVPVGHFTAHDPATDFALQSAFTPYTSIYNVSGRPAVSVPLHWTPGGLPVGIMLAGRIGGESTLISLSAQLEEARPWISRKPPAW